MGGLFTRRLARIAAQRLFIVLISKWPAGAKLFRAVIACALLVSTSFLHPGSVAAEIVTEDFQAYPVQSDTTGILVEEPGHPTETIFRITTTGNTGPSDPIVAVVSEVLAASAGIGTEGANRFWTLGSSAGQTIVGGVFDGFVLIGDIGLGDAPDIITTGGPFASFFSVPRNLTGATITARVRETIAPAATQFRFLLADSLEGEFVTSTFPLTPAFQTFNVNASDFTTRLDPDEGPFDFTKVVGVGFEFLTTPGTAPAFSFNVDDIQLDAPEPAKAMPWLSLLLD